MNNDDRNCAVSLVVRERTQLWDRTLGYHSPACQA